MATQGRNRLTAGRSMFRPCSVISVSEFPLRLFAMHLEIHVLVTEGAGRHFLWNPLR